MHQENWMKFGSSFIATHTTTSTGHLIITSGFPSIKQTVKRTRWSQVPRMTKTTTAATPLRHLYSRQTMRTTLFRCSRRTPRTKELFHFPHQQWTKTVTTARLYRCPSRLYVPSLQRSHCARVIFLLVIKTRTVLCNFRGCVGEVVCGNVNSNMLAFDGSNSES